MKGQCMIGCRLWQTQCIPYSVGGATSLCLRAPMCTITRVSRPRGTRLDSTAVEGHQLRWVVSFATCAVFISSTFAFAFTTNKHQTVSGIVVFFVLGSNMQCFLGVWYQLRNKFERFRVFFWNYFVDSNSNFLVVQIISKKTICFLCVRSSFTYNVTVHVHVLWLVFANVLIRCRDTADTHTQTTYTAQTNHTSIPTVVVSLMIHDNFLSKYVQMYKCYKCTNVQMYKCTNVQMYMYMYMYKCTCTCTCTCIYVYIYIYGHMYIWIYVCVCVCLVLCFVVLCCAVLSGPDRW